MELTIDKRKIEINEKFKQNLSFWDLCFWQNNPVQINNESEVGDKLRAFVEIELGRAYSRAENPQYFEIAPDSKDLDRYFQAQLRAMEARGESTVYHIMNSESIKAENARIFGEKQHAEYKHLVDYLSTANYPDSFKWLILNETLSSVYRVDFSTAEPRLSVSPRKTHQAIAGMMNLPSNVIDFIYKNAPKAGSFKKLYLDAQLEFQKVITRANGVTLENVDTMDKGQWIKFDSRESDPKNFDTNVQKLKALVAKTPWCTSTLAANQLEEGDFYVFVDNQGEPHIAIKMYGNEIDEVRGIQNGNGQELEKDYRDVALNFLENNKEIKNGKEWLDKEEWNARLIAYNEQIEDGTFDYENIPKLLKDLMKPDYKLHFASNSNMDNLRDNLPELLPQFAKYFDCEENEISVSGYYAGGRVWHPFDTKKCPYKIVIGGVYCVDAFGLDMSNLTTIVGNACFVNAREIDLSNLTTIVGKADFSEAQICDLGSLTTIKGEAVFQDACIENLGNLTSIGGSAYFRGAQIRDLKSLSSIGGGAYFNSAKIEDLSGLTSIKGEVIFAYAKIKDFSGLTCIDGHASFGTAQIEDMSGLTSILGDAYFNNARVENLSNLTNISRDAYFNDSEIGDLGSLVSIGGKARFLNARIKNLSSLESIGDMTFINSKTKLGDIDMSDLRSRVDISGEIRYSCEGKQGSEVVQERC